MKKRRKSFSQIISSALSHFFGKGNKEEKQAEKIHSKRRSTYSPEKQKKLEELCESLFEKKELMTTGKIQFLGLGRVKRKLGKDWDGLRPIVHETVEAALDKFLYSKDLYIRYKDDTYAIIFAKTDPAEAQVKMTLISEEIRRALFEHENENLRELDVDQSVSQVSPEHLKTAEGMDDMMDIIMEDRPELDLRPKAPVEIKPTFEIDPYDPKNKLKDTVEEDKAETIPCQFVPMWDVKKKLLTTYLCLPKMKSNSADIQDNYEGLASGLTASEKLALDLKILHSTTKVMIDCAASAGALYVVCPIQYETLKRTSSHEKYILACQKIPEEFKDKLIFLVVGLPEKLVTINMDMHFGTIKKHCHALYAQVPLESSTELSPKYVGYFDAVGVRLKALQHSEKEMIQKLNTFNKLADERLIPKVFALDVPSLSITTSAVCAGVDILAGGAIHAPVEKPDSVHQYAYQNLFEDIVDKKTGS
jgi:hypothetical protein